MSSTDRNPPVEPSALAGTSAIASVQMGADIIDSMNPASNWQPAAQLLRDEWQEAKVAINGDPEHGIPFKDPEIPDTDAVVGTPSGFESLPADDPSGYDTGGYDTGGYDGAAPDTTSYDTTSYDTTSYDTTSYDASTDDTGGAFGTVSDDTGSSFTDFE